MGQGRPTAIVVGYEFNRIDDDFGECGIFRIKLDFLLFNLPFLVLGFLDSFQLLGGRHTIVKGVPESKNPIEFVIRDIGQSHGKQLGIGCDFVNPGFVRIDYKVG